MARRTGGGGQPPMKGFRPGKEPPQLRKVRARQQFAEASPAQRRLLDMLADRTPAEGREMLRAWRRWAVGAALVLGVVGALLYPWSVVVGVLVHILAVVVFVVWWRMHSQREAFDAMVDAVGGPKGGAGRKR